MALVLHLRFGVETHGAKVGDEGQLTTRLRSQVRVMRAKCCRAVLDQPRERLIVQQPLEGRPDRVEVAFKQLIQDELLLKG